MSASEFSFDTWAASYDDIVASESRGYPFEGYREVLERVREHVTVRDGTTVLDIGVGTGLLSRPLYDAGADIYGVDLSPAMLERAKQKMPGGSFFLCDISDGLPKELHCVSFDYILSSYALHHLDDTGKLVLLAQLKSRLKTGGTIIVADIAFETAADLERVRRDAGDGWDASEYYYVAGDFLPELERAGFDAAYTQVSCCAGVMVLRESTRKPRFMIPRNTAPV